MSPPSRRERANRSRTGATRPASDRSSGPRRLRKYRRGRRSLPTAPAPGLCPHPYSPTPRRRTGESCPLLFVRLLVPRDGLDLGRRGRGRVKPIVQPLIDQLLGELEADNPLTHRQDLSIVTEDGPFY